MEAYAIRDKTTGMFIPFSTKKYSRAIPNTRIYPRLFPTKRSAQSALSQWLQGIWRQYGYRDSNTVEYEYDFAPHSQPERIKANMEIVKFKIFEVKNHASTN